MKTPEQRAREAARNIDLMFDGKLNATDDMAAIILRAHRHEIDMQRARFPRPLTDDELVVSD
jgi:hypothetical protein